MLQEDVRVQPMALDYTEAEHLFGKAKDQMLFSLQVVGGFLNYFSL